ncbi:MAG TPA: hypothetical protein PK880_00005, partial [Candidatus Competibacter sp.]|nr:hypothetical protein [Candidatus Competibacter sp.]
MSKNLHDLRFAVRRADGYVSNIWRLWITPIGDVYLSIRQMGGIEKYSFHKSGICRSAFTTEYGTPKTLQDRKMFGWRRLTTPERGSGQATRVIGIALPSDFLSRPQTSPIKKVVWIEAAPAGHATFIDMAYTNESKDQVDSAFHKNGRKLLSYTQLPGTEAFLVSSYHGEWENSDLEPIRKFLFMGYLVRYR